MKWITNILKLYYYLYRDDPKVVGNDFQWYKLYCVDTIIDDPKANQHYSVDQLKEMGFVGIYKIHKVNCLWEQTTTSKIR